MADLTPGTGEPLYLPQNLWAQMRDDVIKHAPEEACGLVGGSGSQAKCIFPIENILHSTVRYRMSPQGQLDAFLELEAANLELIAIYHSHPRGPATPSKTDIAEAFYPESIYLIWAPLAEDWSVRAFWIQNQQVEKVEIRLK